MMGPVDPQEPPGRGFNRQLLLLAVPTVFIGLRAGSEADSVLVGVAAAAGVAAGFWCLIVAVRHRAVRRVDALDRGAELEVDILLDFASLPGEWPKRARKTLNLLARGNTPALAVRLSMGDGALRMDKRQSWGNGRRGLRATIDLREITAVRTAGAQFMPIGSTLLFDLRDGTTIRSHLQLPRRDAERLADHVRLRLRPTTAVRTWPAGIVIEADLPSAAATPNA